ncbi:MAG: spore coat protein CotJB [Firmicutes bacterium]|nr:spore coat protein CotJB [Bacillota bacterium]MDY2720541.1 spore coat protein CotJB [Candidatus Faecousia sp.]
MEEKIQQKMPNPVPDGQGILPANAPLANPYVPFQPENPAKYTAKKGFVRGTLFPGLDLPFMGMVNKNEKPATPLQELQALGFAIYELVLYLDTHQQDRQALELFRDYVRLYQEGKAKYEAQYGPLTAMQAGTGGVYNWVNSPWPWEYQQEKED